MTTIPSGEMFEIIAALRPYLHLSTQKSLYYAIRDLGWSRRNLYEHHSTMPPVSVRHRVWHTSTGVTTIVTVDSDTVHHDCALTVIKYFDCVSGGSIQGCASVCACYCRLRIPARLWHDLPNYQLTWSSQWQGVVRREMLHYHMEDLRCVKKLKLDYSGQRFQKHSLYSPVRW